MKNYEKYAEDIKSLQGVELCNVIAKPKVLKPLDRFCDTTHCAHCQALISLWLLEDYEEQKEPEVDWSKVEVDTPILVKDFEHCEWMKRHFAKYYRGKVYGWDDGKTSWSVEDNNMSVWKYAKLAD